MKPIEPGCTAIVVGHLQENLGKIVKVGRCLGKSDVITTDGEIVHNLNGYINWEVDKLIAMKVKYIDNGVCRDTVYTYTAIEKYLRRLDDDDKKTDSREIITEDETNV